MIRIAELAAGLASPQELRAAIAVFMASASRREPALARKLLNPAGVGDSQPALERALSEMEEAIRTAGIDGADVDEAAWESLYRTVSRPFPAPATGQIAVKVINHYGDEVMKVYPVPSSR